MQIHQISANKNQKTKKRVGRGGKRGTYSGRGMKGQRSRSGRKLRPEWRDALKSIPKRRGYKFKPVGEKPVVLNLGILGEIFKEGELVSKQSLREKKLIFKIKNALPEVKILSDGDLAKKLDFRGVKVSQAAKWKIEKAGGKIII